MHCITSETGRLFYQMDNTTPNVKYYCCYCINITFIDIGRKLFLCLKYFRIYFLIDKWSMTSSMSVLEVFRETLGRIT